MELRVNLKVCEGCGCLWYRAQVETRVYCTSCHERFKEFPIAQSRKRRGRPKKTILPTVFAVEAQAEHTSTNGFPGHEGICCFERTPLQPRYRPNTNTNTNTISGTLTPEGMPFAFLASNAALSQISAAQTGGAQ
jgi:hypothetical protein